MSTQVDVVVVGLGPGGESLASRLAGAGLDVVGVDQHLVGGECPYYGCVPSKMMVHGAALVAEARRVDGNAGHAEVAPDWTPVAERIAGEATDHWNDQVAVDRLTDAGVRFVRGHGQLTGDRTVTVGEETFEARVGVVLNTGTEPAVPPIPGLADTPYWTNRDAVQVTSLPASLIVIGGGAIGVEMAQAFSRFGVQVSVVEVGERLLAPEEPESSKLLADVFAAEGIQVRTGVTIEGVSYDDGRFTVALADEELHADKLLVAAGRRPHIADVGLDSVGLDPTVRAIGTDSGMKVKDGLWAIGDITGNGAFTHMSMYEAAVAADDILGSDEPMRADYRAVPHVTFTDPEVASVGITEKQARDKGLDVRVGLTDLSASTRGWIQQAQGLIKLVEDRERGVLVGATVVGPAGGEILSGLVVAVHGEVPTATLASMIYAYPTLHRALEVAVQDLHD